MAVAVAGDHDCSDDSPVAELEELAECDAVSIESCANETESSAFFDCSEASPAGSAAVAAVTAGLPHSQPSVLESTDLTVPNTPRGCEDAAEDEDEKEDEEDAPADGFALVSRRTYG